MKILMFSIIIKIKINIKNKNKIFHKVTNNKNYNNKIHYLVY